MIKSINNTGPWVNVQGGGSYNSVYIDNYKVQQGIAGQVRYNGTEFEVNDGTSWKTLASSYATIDLSGMANDALNWAMKKMVQEREAEGLAKTNQAVASALEEYKAIIAIAEERLEVVMTLAKEHA